MATGPKNNIRTFPLFFIALWLNLLCINNNQIWVSNALTTSKFGEFISAAEVALVCLKLILSFIKFCSLAT